MSEAGDVRGDGFRKNSSTHPRFWRRQSLSRVKTPQEKKRLSYEHDRRDTYGENHKSSRKNIPLSKQRSHKDERRSVKQALVIPQGAVADDFADEAQSKALTKGRMKKLTAFRKWPNSSLREVIDKRLQRRTGKHG